MLRHAKVPSDVTGNLILAVLEQDLDEKDYVYREGLSKIQSNISTWKNQILQHLEVNHISKVSATVYTNILFRTTFKPQLTRIKPVCWLVKLIQKSCSMRSWCCTVTMTPKQCSIGPQNCSNLTSLCKMEG